MDVLMSNWSNVVACLPEKYIFPPDKRPGKHDFPVMNNLPVIDLSGENRARIVQQIVDASQKFGLFQVINHSVPVALMNDTMNVFQEFFQLPPEYKSTFYSNDMSKKCKIYSSTLNYDNEDFHYWRDNFTHHCHPLQDYVSLWPQNPTRYREVVGTYSIETRAMMLRILDLICEGLGIKDGHFDNEVSSSQLLSVNHHIPCPDPSMTLGMPPHSDPNLITILHQCSVSGLQVLSDGQWMNVDPMPNAFLVITGLQLTVMSNGKFSSPFHRVMTHSQEARTTIGTFLIPSNDVVIEPAKECANDDPVYRGFTYTEFFKALIGSNCDPDITLGVFKNPLAK